MKIFQLIRSAEIFKICMCFCSQTVAVVFVKKVITNKVSSPLIAQLEVELEVGQYKQYMVCNINYQAHIIYVLFSAFVLFCVCQFIVYEVD